MFDSSVENRYAGQNVEYKQFKKMTGLKNKRNPMNKLLKFRQADGSKVWFGSDFHLNHNPKWPVPIWQDRGFSSVEDMNRGILKSINNNIRQTDTLIYLGDFCLNTLEHQFENLLSQIVCGNIIMLWGNHNSCVWDRYKTELKTQFGRNDLEVYPLQYKNITFVGNYLELYVDSQFFVVTHYPQFSWNKMSKGAIHCHGHIHSKRDIYNLPGKCRDVGFDFWRRPVAADELMRELSSVSIQHEGHH
jgi:calcineurin-like phosphoesterase family protein